MSQNEPSWPPALGELRYQFGFATTHHAPNISTWVYCGEVEEDDFGYYLFVPYERWWSEKETKKNYSDFTPADGVRVRKDDEHRHEHFVPWNDVRDRVSQWVQVGAKYTHVSRLGPDDPRAAPPDRQG